MQIKSGRNLQKCKFGIPVKASAPRVLGPTIRNISQDKEKVCGFMRGLREHAFLVPISRSSAQRVLASHVLRSIWPLIDQMPDCPLKRQRTKGFKCLCHRGFRSDLAAKKTAKKSQLWIKPSGTRNIVFSHLLRIGASDLNRGSRLAFALIGRRSAKMSSFPDFAVLPIISKSESPRSPPAASEHSRRVRSCGPLLWQCDRSRPSPKRLRRTRSSHTDRAQIRQSPGKRCPPD